MSLSRSLHGFLERFIRQLLLTKTYEIDHKIMGGRVVHAPEAHHHARCTGPISGLIDADRCAEVRLTRTHHHERSTFPKGQLLDFARIPTAVGQQKETPVHWICHIKHTVCGEVD